jgi:MFS family permease
MTMPDLPAPDAPDAPAARAYALNVGEGVAVITAGAFFSQTAILPLFVAHHTDAPWVLGLIPAIALLGGQLPQLLGAAAVARSRDFRRTFLAQTALPRVLIAVVALTPWLPGPWALGAFFVAYALYTGACGYNAPSWFEFVTHVIPSRARGRFFGDRNTLGGLAGLAGLAGSGWLLATLPYPANFSACFLVAAALWVVSFSCMASTRHDWATVDAARGEPAPFLAGAIALLRDHAGFRAYVVARWLVAGSVMGVAFHVVHAQRHFHLSTAQSSMLAISLTLLPSLTGGLWGRLSDRLGNRLVQVPVATAAALASWLLLVAPSLGVYAAGLFVIGCANVVMNIADSKWLTELAPGRCGAVVSVFNLAMCPASVLFSLAAGLLAQRFGMPATFFAAGACWLLGAMALAGLELAERRARVASAA